MSDGRIEVFIEEPTYGDTMAQIAALIGDGGARSFEVGYLCDHHGRAECNCVPQAGEPVTWYAEVLMPRGSRHYAELRSDDHGVAGIKVAADVLAQMGASVAILDKRDDA